MTAVKPSKVHERDAIPNRRRGGDIRVTLSPKTCGSTSGFGGTLRLAAGEFVTEHYHPYSEEFIHLVSGQLVITLDDEPVELGPGDSLMVPINVRHRVRNAGEGEAHVVFHLSPLAPRPELGHVDTEEVVHPEVTVKDVGGGG